MKRIALLIFTLLATGSCFSNGRKVMNKINPETAESSMITGTLYYFNDVPWLFHPFGDWTPDVFFSKKNRDDGRVKNIMLPDSCAAYFYRKADSLSKAQQLEKRSHDIRYAIIFNNGGIQDTLYSDGGIKGYFCFNGTEIADSILLQKIINIIFERDLAWKEKYEQYFFDGDQQPYTKEFMIEHNML
jgi:hypothetical protein